MTQDEYLAGIAAKQAGNATPPAVASAPNALPSPLAERDLSRLPEELKAFLLSSIPETAGLTPMERMIRLENYRKIRSDFDTLLTFEEYRHVVLLLSDTRAETLRQAKSNAGKKATSAPASKPMSLDDLL